MVRNAKRVNRITVVTLALAFSLAWATPALADDGVPPAEVVPAESAEPGTEVLESGGASETGPAPEAETPPATEETVVELQGEDESASESGGAEDETAPEGQGIVEHPAAPPTELELLNEVPEGTEVVVTDEGGEILPLATEAAAEAVIAGDPIWCPEGVTPNAGVGGCTASYASLQDLINDLTASQPSSNGVIWIEKGYDSSVNDAAATVFTLDGNVLTTMAAYRLTIQGGWDGLGTKTVDTSDPSEFNARLNIFNWGNDVTINDLLFTGTTGNHALWVTTSGKINVERVRVDANDFGAQLSNTSGTADVRVTLSEFTDNTAGNGSGLYVYSNGMITLSDVIASGNDYYGAYLDNSSAATPRNVVLISGVFEFNDNGATGLMIFSKGVITLRDIVATGNGFKPAATGRGAYLSNTAGTNKGVTLLGTNVFSENDDGGMQVYSNGAVRANNLVANANPNGWGVWIENQTATSAQPVTLTGTNEFKFNGLGGLQVASNGNITTSNLTASNNLGNLGASLYNDYAGYSSPVTLNGTNVFMDNYASGLEVYSNGTIKANNLSASGNGILGASGFGAYLTNSSASGPRPVTVTGTNSFFNNYSGGLYVYSAGAITAGNLTASSSLNNNGANLSNTSSGASSPQRVTLTGTNAFHDNNGDGLSVYSYGAVTLNNVSANYNGDDGVIVENETGTKPQPVTLNGYGEFNYNANDGLQIYSLGQITTVNVTANGNSGNGAYLRNNYVDAKGAVNVRGMSAFNNNGGEGLYVLSRGNILVQDLEAIANGDDGVYLLNNYAGANANVSVGTGRANWCNGFMSNQNSGIQVISNGTVTLSNICAESNGQSGFGGGAYVDNSSAVSPRPVIIRGVNRFNHNEDEGLVVYSAGAITASNLEAVASLSASGVYLVSTISGDTSPQNVTITGSNDFHNNYNSGLEVYTFGVIRVNNAQASGNGWGGTYGYGLFLDNYMASATLPRSISLTGESGLYDNYSGGLYARSLGAINLSRVDASNNNTYGALINNNNAGAKGGITLSGYAIFDNNSGYGLQAQSLGAITATNLEASSNSDYGVLLNNANLGAVGAVTLNGDNYFDDNLNWWGLDVSSFGVIKANNLHAWGNDSYGVLLNNAGGKGAVVLSGYASFVNNSGDGLIVDSAGAVTAKDLFVAGNNEDGVSIDNQASGIAAPQNVTLNGTNIFIYNGFDGLQVDSYGQIVLSNITADNNGQSAVNGNGLTLDNSGTIARNVLLNGTNQFNDNYEDGLWVNSLGAIKVNRATASGNGQNGLYLDNQQPGAVATINLTGYATLENNGDTGMSIYSNGNVTMSDINANWNEYDGAYINTLSDTTGTRSVMLNGTNNFLGNGQSGASGSGLWVDSDGLIKANNLIASWNFDNGAFLDNDNYGATGANITLTGANVFNDNGIYGLQFESTGDVVVNNLVGDNNGFDGVNGTTTSDITISCGSLTSNGNIGWDLTSPGTVTLKGVFAFGNSTANSFFGGSGTLIIKHSCP